MELCCEADGHLMWSRLGTALTSLPFFQQGGCITIINLNRENAGKYICRATNQFGISEATSEVILTGDHLYSVLFSLGVSFCFVYTLSGVIKYHILTVANISAHDKTQCMVKSVVLSWLDLVFQ